MNRARCLQILGLGLTATPSEIHDAYLDLVRIWHPDRFSSNPRLQIKVAEELRKINEAYAALRAERDNDPARPQQCRSSSYSQSRLWPNLRKDEDRCFNSGGWPFPHVGYALTVAAVCALPLLTAAYVIAQLRVPVLDFKSIMTAARPRILMPMAIADPSAGVQTAVENLTEWARGRALDLWRPPGWHSTTPPVIVAQPTEAESDTAIRTGSKRKHAGLGCAPKAGQPDAPSATDLEHGTELLVAGSRVGLGELRVVNRARTALRFGAYF